jgi:ferredoxin
MNETDFKTQCKKDIIEETELANNKIAEEECPVQCIKIEEIKE